MVIMESTSHYHLPWARGLQEAHHEVYVLNPLLASRMSSFRNTLRKNKTDPIDAGELTEIGVKNEPELAHYLFKEEPARKGLMALCKARKRLVEMIKDTLIGSRCLIETMLPDLGPIKIHENKGLAELFLKVESLESFKRMHRSTIEKYACTATDQFIKALRGYIPSWRLFDPLLPALHAQLKAVQALRQVLLETEEAIRKATKADPQRHEDTKLARTIPGFGALNTPPIIAALPDEWRSWAPTKRILSRKLQAFFGCDPRLKSSGTFQGQVHLSKRGVTIARTALFQSCTIGMLVDPHLRDAYDRQRARGKHYRVAITHIMRIQLQRLIAILVNRKPFDSSLNSHPQPA
jgi:transposase